MSARRFEARVNFDGSCWWALVYVQGAQSYYWRGARFTRHGARFAAWRKARRLNSLEAKGLVR